MSWEAGESTAPGLANVHVAEEGALAVLTRILVGRLMTSEALEERPVEDIVEFPLHNG